MASVDQLGITTVINKEEFKNNVLVKDCPVVGRSLVAKRPLVPGDVVLVEEPLIKYDLKPTCRSTKSPYYSRKLWDLLISMVHDEEDQVADDQVVIHDQVQEEQVDDFEYDEQDYSSEDESSDEDDDAEVNPDSDFCPGVPAAIIAYLDIHPPSSFTNVRKSKTYQQSDFDFFYYPNTDTEPGWLDHKTIRLIHTVTQKVVDTVPLYAHVDPFDLRSFVLKIYSNAHTVSLPRCRTLPTHSARKARRSKYEHKFGNNGTYWGEDAIEPPNTPTIALLRWGSKFAHSCSPNMFLRFEPTRNAMIFTVIRPLKEGDVLSFSYLPEDDSTVGGLVCGAVSDRRAKLQKFKFFKCTCERCVDWDWSRGIACKECNQPCSYRDDHGKWTCFDCSAIFTDTDASFIGEREENVQRMVMGFAMRVNGNRRINESMMRMLEPYLMDLLDPAPEKNQVAVPKNHWTFGVIHSLLAHYHLALFPQSFGKGLASQLGLTVKGLEEALVYIEFLNSTIRTHEKSESASQSNSMAAFFAGWRVLTLVIDLIMDSTENKYANISYEKDDSSDSDLDDDQVIIKEDEKVAVDQTAEIALIPLTEDWIVPVTKIADIVNKEWIPLIEQVFQSHQSVVVEDMLRQIKSFADRVKQTSALTKIEQ